MGRLQLAAAMPATRQVAVFDVASGALLRTLEDNHLGVASTHRRSMCPACNPAYGSAEDSRVESCVEVVDSRAAGADSCDS
eukprot:1182532-Prorocentrum_minimum.AAC.3